MNEKPEKDKVTHYEARYTHPSPFPKMKCATCVHLITAPFEFRCEGVKSPILPEDWCQRWKAIQ